VIENDRSASASLHLTCRNAIVDDELGIRQEMPRRTPVIKPVAASLDGM
jgi:hypothetical protein